MVAWKMYFRIKDPVAYITDYKHIYTDKYNSKEVVEKSIKYCEENNHEFLKVSYDYSY